ncbi:hypothetical protein ACGF0D_15995 [Kitasatospora sp. NPDC048298]|uniref:hypothetical protein n=1 Tax=Kitasatospora sp. NPDC048298 TaxID=3364049 RepID=UPI0037103355
MTSTVKRRRTTLVCTAAALGLAVAGALAVLAPPPSPNPVQAHPVERTEPAVAYDPAQRPSGTSRSGVRALLPGAGAPADAALLADGQGPR